MLQCVRVALVTQWLVHVNGQHHKLESQKVLISSVIKYCITVVCRCGTEKTDVRRPLWPLNQEVEMDKYGLIVENQHFNQIPLTSINGSHTFKQQFF